jgi:hypothetical protein
MGQLNGEPAALQSRDHRDLLDVIDGLRSQGLGRYVDLPQIIVCGDQSSGKSSALEAISGMSFPAKDNLCTRFATELILRRTPATGIDISIIPGSERSDKEKAKLEGFGHKHTGALEELDLGEVVENAKDIMGLNSDSKVFSTDILRVELSGPAQPHLTLVDLPGLFLAGNKDQSEEDAALVEALVLSYMQNPRTIILAVVSAKSDFALQQVTRHARAQDPKGARTLGLITKPDTLDEGSDSERFYVELAQNKDVQFRLGWHVLRNRTCAERDASTAARDAAEAAFFSKGVWKSLKPSQLGVAALRVRLSHVLRDQILKQLPSVLDDVTEGLNDCKSTLARLGAARSTMAEQRRYLLRVSTEFSDLARAAIDGIYTHAFFNGPKDRCLRAVIQNTLAGFAEEMRKKGHARAIVDEEAASPEHPNPEDSDNVNVPPSVPRSEYIKEVKQLMQETRGRELPGTYNPLIVTELFRKQCKPWQDMVQSLLERVFAAVAKTTDSILRYVADGETAEALLSQILNPTLEDLKKELSGKADEVLQPHVSGHPITYNHYLTDNVQKAQAERLRRQVEGRLETYFKNTDDRYDRYVDKSKLRKLRDTLMTELEPDMDTYSCSMAIDMMQAYYKVRVSLTLSSVHSLCNTCLPSWNETGRIENSRRLH